MGFGSGITQLASDGLDYAIGLLGEYTPLIAVVFGVFVLGLLFAAVRRFMPH